MDFTFITIYIFLKSYTNSTNDKRSLFNGNSEIIKDSNPQNLQLSPFLVPHETLSFPTQENFNFNQSQKHMGSHNTNFPKLYEYYKPLQNPIENSNPEITFLPNQYEILKIKGDISEESNFTKLDPHDIKLKINPQISTQIPNSFINANRTLMPPLLDTNSVPYQPKLVFPGCFLFQNNDSTEKGFSKIREENILRSILFGLKPSEESFLDSLDDNSAEDQAYKQGSFLNKNKNSMVRARNLRFWKRPGKRPQESENERSSSPEWTSDEDYLPLNAKTTPAKRKTPKKLKSSRSKKSDHSLTFTRRQTKTCRKEKSAKKTSFSLFSSVEPGRRVGAFRMIYNCPSEASEITESPKVYRDENFLTKKVRGLVQNIGLNTGDERETERIHLKITLDIVEILRMKKCFNSGEKGYSVGPNTLNVGIAISNYEYKNERRNKFIRFSKQREREGKALMLQNEEDLYMKEYRAETGEPEYSLGKQAIAGFIKEIGFEILIFVEVKFKQNCNTQITSSKDKSIRLGHESFNANLQIFCRKYEENGVLNGEIKMYSREDIDRILDNKEHYDEKCFKVELRYLNADL